MLSDSVLSLAGWLFFAVWGLIVAGLSVAAFARDLFPAQERQDSTQKDRM